MDSPNSLPAFDPEAYLTAAHLRAVEREHGYDRPAGALPPLKPGDRSDAKILKAQFETRMFADACVRFAKLSADFPPYALPVPPQVPALLLAPEPVVLEVGRLDEGSTVQSLQMMSINALHSLSDLKLQLLINELLAEALPTAHYAQAADAGRENTAIVSNGRTDSWKVAIQSAASNAKRSGFIVLKQIFLQWVIAHKGAMPTRTQFLESAYASQELLEMLATTHQAVFKTLNGRIIRDASGRKYHRMVRHGGAGRVALDRGIVDKLDVETGHPSVRTMCAALLARDDDGISLLEHSYREDARMVADQHFDGEDAIPERVMSTLNSRLPDPSVHMYLKLKAFTPPNG
ncbi:MAG TPA: hypothetical protein PKV72_02300 [Candidatus Peribacteria bacterium]|nr:hypothetical protein [Candidatus Peribacteria bacterium]